MDETTLPVTEPAPSETLPATDPTISTEGWETIDTTTETEYVPLEEYYSEPVTEPAVIETLPVETVPEETITIIDYTPVIIDTGNNICSCFLFGCLAICGVLCALRLWGVRSS